MLSTMENILTTVEGYRQYRGGCSVPCGEFHDKYGVPDTSTHLSWYIPMVLNMKNVERLNIPYNTDDIQHTTEHPPQYSRYTPTLLKISPMVLNTPTVLKIFPHGTQDITTLYWADYH